MTTLAEYERYVDWDVRNWATAPAFWESRTQLDLPRCLCLELGSRHGGLSLWLAQRGARVVCSDLGGPSPEARLRHAAAGVANRICYAHADATELQYDEQFDIIVFKSMLGALDGCDRRAVQAAAIAAMHRALRPGGELFFAENLAASPAHRFLRERFVQWGRRWRYVTLEEMREFLAPFSSVEFDTVGLTGALGRNQQQRRMLGAVDRLGLDRLVPPSWRYIMLGVARK